VIIIALFHSSLDSVDGSGLLPNLNYYVFIGALALVALLLILFTRGRLGYRPTPDLLPVPPA
jgi:hypothetical protein